MSAGLGSVTNGREVLDAAMSERELFEAVRAHLDAFGWRWYHCRPAQSGAFRWSTPMAGHPGMPDIIAAKDKRLLFIELKTKNGRLRPEQEAWLKELDGAGGESHTPYGAKAFVWRPSDLSDGTVERVLRGSQ